MALLAQVLEKHLALASAWKPSFTTPGGPLIRTLEGHTNSVNAVAVTPDGLRVLSSSGDRTLGLWDIGTGPTIRQLECHTDWVWAVAITPDGLRAVSASWDRTLRLWDLRTGQTLHSFEGHTSSVFALALTPDGCPAVSASADRTLRLWDLSTGQSLRSFEGHTDRVEAVAVTSDGLRAVSASSDRTLRLWDLESGEEITTFTGESDMVSCAVAPDGRTIVVGERSGRVHFLRLVERDDIKLAIGETNCDANPLLIPARKAIILVTSPKDPPAALQGRSNGFLSSVQFPLKAFRSFVAGYFRGVARNLGSRTGRPTVVETGGVELVPFFWTLDGRMVEQEFFQNGGWYVNLAIGVLPPSFGARQRWRGNNIALAKLEASFYLDDLLSQGLIYCDASKDRCFFIAKSTCGCRSQSTGSISTTESSQRRPNESCAATTWPASHGSSATCTNSRAAARGLPEDFLNSRRKNEGFERDLQILRI